jgi:endonuclease III related protein
MANTGTALMAMYEAMLSRTGPLGWWPGRTRFEVCVGAILTQNTAWRNVKRAIDNLKRARLLAPAAMLDIDEKELARLIVPSGYYNMKAAKLKNFVNFLYEKHGGSLDRLFKQNVPELRAELLGVNGIGRETADSIILYAAGKPIFVIDAYTRRIFSRHGLLDESADYDALRAFFENNLPADVQLFNEYHALIVFTGHHYCKRNPLCDDCPLNKFPSPKIN